MYFLRPDRIDPRSALFEKGHPMYWMALLAVDMGRLKKFGVAIVQRGLSLRAPCFERGSGFLLLADAHQQAFPEAVRREQDQIYSWQAVLSHPFRELLPEPVQRLLMPHLFFAAEDIISPPHRGFRPLTRWTVFCRQSLSFLANTSLRLAHGFGLVLAYPDSAIHNTF